jgi:hypothetical protein
MSREASNPGLMMKGPLVEPRRSCDAAAVSFERLSWLLVALACACQRQPREESPARSQSISSSTEAEPAESSSVAPLPGLTSFELPEAARTGSAPGLLGGADELQLVFMGSAGEPSLELATMLLDGEERDHQWSETQRITRGERLVVHWADVPAIGHTPSGDAVVAWLEYHADDPAAGYAARVAVQLDDGSFGPAWSPDDVRRGQESGYVTFVPTSDALHMFWLDGRELGGGHDQHGGTMQLRHLTIDAEGQQTGPSSVVDDRTCECCKLGVGLLGGQALAVYRDRSEDEVRDIYVAGPALAPTLVASDGWTIAGCPVNGPAVASSDKGDRMHVAWFTGAQDRSAMYLASATSPQQFGPARAFDLGLPGGRVDLLATPDGGALVSWVELDAAQPGRAKLLTRKVHVDGSFGEPYAVAEFGASRDWGFPRAAWIGEDVVWVYTNPTGRHPKLVAWLAPPPT